MMYLLRCFPCDWRCSPCHQTDSSEASLVPPHQPPLLLQTRVKYTYVLLQTRNNTFVLFCFLTIFLTHLHIRVILFSDHFSYAFVWLKIAAPSDLLSDVVRLINVFTYLLTFNLWQLGLYTNEAAISKCSYTSAKKTRLQQMCSSNSEYCI